MYPVFRINPEKLREVDPRGFRQYCRAAGIETKQQEASKESLAALKKEARERAAGRNLERPEKQQNRTRSHDMEL